MATLVQERSAERLLALLEEHAESVSENSLPREERYVVAMQEALKALSTPTSVSETISGLWTVLFLGLRALQRKEWEGRQRCDLWVDPKTFEVSWELVKLWSAEERCQRLPLKHVVDRRLSGSSPRARFSRFGRLVFDQYLDLRDGQHLELDYRERVGELIGEFEWLEGTRDLYSHREFFRKTFFAPALEEDELRAEMANTDLSKATLNLPVSVSPFDSSTKISLRDYTSGQRAAIHVSRLNPDELKCLLKHRMELVGKTEIRRRCYLYDGSVVHEDRLFSVFEEAGEKDREHLLEQERSAWETDLALALAQVSYEASPGGAG